MNPESAAIYAVVIAALLPGAAGLWIAASLRASFFMRWQDRTEAMSAGLTEGAISLLENLQIRITDLLGSPAAAWEPNRFAANPSELVDLVAKFQKVMKARDSIEPRFHLLLRVGPVLVIAAIGYLLAAVMCGAAWVGLITTPLVLQLGLGLGAVAILTVAIATGVYIAVTHRLSSSEILSYEVLHPLRANRDTEAEES